MSSAGGIAGVGTIPGQAWFDIIKRPTVEEFAAAFSPNAVLEASVVSGVVRGATDIRHVFNATRAMYDKIAFVHQADDGASTYLEWEGSFHGRPVAGVTILARDAEGLIESIRLYHRPYDQVRAFSIELAQRLDGKIAPLPFSHAM